MPRLTLAHAKAHARSCQGSQDSEHSVPCTAFIYKEHQPVSTLLHCPSCCTAQHAALPRHPGTHHTPHPFTLLPPQHMHPTYSVGTPFALCCPRCCNASPPRHTPHTCTYSHHSICTPRLYSAGTPYALCCPRCYTALPPMMPHGSQAHPHTAPPFLRPWMMACCAA